MLDGTPFALEYMNASSVEYMEASEKATEEVWSDLTFLARTQNRDWIRSFIDSKSLVDRSKTWIYNNQEN